LLHFILRMLAFMPLEVSIPQWCDCCLGLRHYAVINDKFQSHNGAIAASAQNPDLLTYTRFQSHNGAIAAYEPDYDTKLASSVSIPQWCDCCDYRHLSVEDAERSFNPTMVRLLLCEGKNAWRNWPSFNPTIVRLLQISHQPPNSSQPGFQSHNGAIAALNYDTDRFLQASFQSHNGAIAASQLQPQMAPMVGFNPTMVRLLHFPLRSLPALGWQFQSHNGAIAAIGVEVRFVNESKFQSHNGAIAAHKSWAGYTWRKKFQSHNGAIAAFIGSGWAVSSGRFQSHNGAIAARSLRLKQMTACFVSIPQWCDCCFYHVVSKPQRCCVSIPQWCDCCQGKILGFEGKRKGNGEGVAVDLRLPENP
jgi:hypothetical protein